MVSLYYTFYKIISFYYTYLYLYTSKVFTLLTFYPVGIALSLCILSWIFYMVVCSSKIITDYLNLLSYYFDFWNLFSYFDCFFPNKFLYQFVSILTNLLYFYSVYLFVFYLKRVEFYIFWFFLFCLFIY